MIPYIKGNVTKQAHVNIPDGLCEEEYARNGFKGRYAHLYRSAPPVNWVDIEGPLKPRCFNFAELSNKEGDFLNNRITYLYNDDVRIQYSSFDVDMDYHFRNADADELFFVHKGTGRLETDFGPLTYVEGDYIVIPRGTVYRLLPKEATELLIMETFSEIEFPDRGMLGQHALFDPAVVQVPEPEAEVDSSKGRYELRIKRGDEYTKVFYEFNPINTLGWKGTLTVWQLNIKDIRPVSSDRYHLPPSAHSTFVAKNFVICSFLPRPLENGDPNCLKVPFYHSNIDFDEVLFYHKGDFFSREGVSHGMLTFHPQGIHHGPQGGAVTRSVAAKETNECAVMIDTRYPLKVAKEFEALENKNYWKSWGAK